MDNVMPVRLYGDPALRCVAKPVDCVTSEIKNLVALLYNTMKHYNGIGIAANQIGFSESVCVMDCGRLSACVLINPTIIMKSDDTCVMGEGCLSFPETYQNIKRPKSIVVKHLGLNGSDCRTEFTGILSRVAQHEIDHLNGVLLIDHDDVNELQ